MFIDDATSRLLALRLVPAETTRACMETLAEYLRQHGRPVALYSDRHSIFRVNHPQREGELTPFSRALKTLDIEAIHAHSPQAKGRVERANQTLQDRLVQELRLRDICDLDTANAFLPAFIQDYNRRFSVAPRNPNEVHRPVLHKESELARIRCLHHTRTLSKNRTCRFHNREYPVQTQAPGYTLHKAAITVCEAFNGSVTLLYQGQLLRYRLLAEGEPPTPLADEKSVSSVVAQAQANQASRPQWKAPELFLAQNTKTSRFRK